MPGLLKPIGQCTDEKLEEIKKVLYDLDLIK